MLNIHQLEIFAKVAELKSFSKAAEEMYLTQPTISQHISTLEHHLETALFDRMGKEVKLTKAGEVLYRYAKQLNVKDVKAIYQGITQLLDEVVEAERIASSISSRGTGFDENSRTLRLIRILLKKACAWEAISASVNSCHSSGINRYSFILRSLHSLGV